MTWLKTNIRDRLENPSLDFKVEMGFSNEPIVNFNYISHATAFNISSKHKSIYIGLSGGMDSEFVCKTFIENCQPFTPVIVDTPANQLEVSYAYHFCKKHDLEPIIISHSEKDLLEIYANEIYKKLNGVGKNSVAALLVGRFAKENGGKYISAEHCIDKKMLSVNEWDFYNEALIENDPTILFFLHNETICRSMANLYDFGEEQEFKHRIYQIPFRPKMYWSYSSAIENAFSKLIISRKHKPNPRFEFKKDFLG